MSEIEKYYLPEGHKKMLNRLLKVVIAVLNKHNITWWADGGTLLGAVRNGSQIPWDDDVDIGVYYDDFIGLKKILSHCVYFGYGIKEEGQNILKVYVPLSDAWVKGEYNSIGTPTLDIFCWKKKNDRITLNGIYDRQEFPNCYHLKKDFYPLKEYKFNDHSVMGPANPIPYLNRMYPDWKTKAVIDIREFDPQTYVTKKINTKSFEIISGGIQLRALPHSEENADESLHQ